MKPRAPLQGMLAIARFNWPFYLAAIAVMAVALPMIVLASAVPVKVAAAAALAGAAWFFVGSLGVSWLVYDRSDLYRWDWLTRAAGNFGGGRGVICHSGFDEVSEPLKETLPGNDWTVLDHFDAKRMTERSIHRARAMFPPVAGTLPCPFDCWPLADGSCGRVFGLLAIHELRSEDERTAWFREASRCLAADGRAVIAEHVRDPANFIAFGPGFLHFHSVAGWTRCWERAGFRLADGFRITPWIRVFVLEKS